jgi:hypothetical protein
MVMAAICDQSTLLPSAKVGGGCWDGLFIPIDLLPHSRTLPLKKVSSVYKILGLDFLSVFSF